VLEAAAAGGSVRRQDVDDFRRLAAAARLAAQATRSAAAGLDELAAKQRTALLRYLGIIPADKVGPLPAAGPAAGCLLLCYGRTECCLPSCVLGADLAQL
jgi:hypothetical protein